MVAGQKPLGSVWHTTRALAPVHSLAVRHKIDSLAIIPIAQQTCPVEQSSAPSQPMRLSHVPPGATQAYPFIIAADWQHS